VFEVVAERAFSSIPARAGTHSGARAMFYDHMLASKAHGALYIRT
jgi:hypothetical protein